MTDTTKDESSSTDQIDVPLLEISNNAATSPNVHIRIEENQTTIWLTTIIPLILHLLSVITLILVLKFYIDKRDFNLKFRNALFHFTPLQSDITTAVSAGITIIRFFAAIWSAEMIWRCVFILMERDGISLHQINSLFFWQNHFHPRLKSSHRTGLVVSIVLLLCFPSQLSGPILTGSITWSSSNGLIHGGNISQVPSGDTGDMSSSYFTTFFPLNLSQATVGLYSIAQQWAVGYAILAWDAQGGHRTMKRVIGAARDLPTNSIVNNITLPYFSISKLEWIEDPINELPPLVLRAHDYLSDWNPFLLGLNVFAYEGTFAIIPDEWGVANPPSAYNGIIMETRVIVGMTTIRDLFAPPADCPKHSEFFGDIPANIGQYNDTFGCFIYGRITYVAGAAECCNCRVSSPYTFQNDTEVTVSPSNSTIFALAIMPKVGSLINAQNFSLPAAINNLDDYVTEYFIRSYSASWSAISAILPIQVSPFLQTDGQIAVPTSRANILWWRVILWLSLNLMFTLSGVLFLVTQRTCDQPMIGNPRLAALLLDATEVLHKRNRALCNFSTLVNDDKGIGNLYLRRTEELHKHVEAEERCLC